jgi:hypothetical protein
VTRTSPATVVLLTLLTFGLYGLYWMHRSTKELKEATGRPELDPTVDVVLTVFTLGLWALWVAVRNAGVVREALGAHGVEARDRSTEIALFGALTYWTLWAALVPMALLQQEYNKLADAQRALMPPLDFRAPASYREWSPSARTRVESPAAEVPAAGLGAEERGEAFRSAAPAPHVF